MDATPLPTVQLSRDRTMMLLSYRTSMPSIAEVTAPWIGLAGSRINPRNNGPRVMGATTGLVLKNVATGAEKKLAIPAGGTFSGSFSPDGKKLAITHTTDTAVRLLIADVATGQITTVLNGGINALAGGCTWLETSTGFFCRLIPEGRGPAPAKPQVPSGPNIQENIGKTAPGRTYQDLLTSAYDEKLLRLLLRRRQLAWVALNGTKTNIGAPAVYQGASRSDDGKYLVVTRVKRPYSYLVPAVPVPARRRAVGPHRQGRAQARRRADGRHDADQRRVRRPALLHVPPDPARHAVLDRGARQGRLRTRSRIAIAS